MHFDRFDIAEAYYVYYTLWHVGGLTERDYSRVFSISQRLSRLCFHPSPHVREADEDGLSENGRAIYDALVERWEASA